MFDSNDNSWSVSANGETTKFMTFIDENHVQLPGVDGNNVVVELSQAGCHGLPRGCTIQQSQSGLEIKSEDNLIKKGGNRLPFFVPAKPTGQIKKVRGLAPRTI